MGRQRMLHVAYIEGLVKSRMVADDVDEWRAVRKTDGVFVSSLLPLGPEPVLVTDRFSLEQKLASSNDHRFVVLCCVVLCCVVLCCVVLCFLFSHRFLRALCRFA